MNCHGERGEYMGALREPQGERIFRRSGREGMNPSPTRGNRKTGEAPPRPYLIVEKSTSQDMASPIGGYNVILVGALGSKEP